MKKIFIISCMLVLYHAAWGQQTTPIFDGGLGGYVASQLNNHNLEGRDEKLDSIKGAFVVVVKFFVDVDGSVDAEIYQGAHPILDKEVLRIFNSMPKDKWTPAFNNGKPVKTYVIYPVSLKQ